MSSAGRWKDISALYAAALDQPAAERAAFVDEACAGDEVLQREVESLLACHADAQQMLATPAADVLARAMGPEPRDGGRTIRTTDQCLRVLETSVHDEM